MPRLYWGHAPFTTSTSLGGPNWGSFTPIPSTQKRSFPSKRTTLYEWTDCESKDRIITAQRINGYINDNDKVGGDVTNLAERTTGEPEPPISSTQTLGFAAMSARRVDRLSSPIAQGS